MTRTLPRLAGLRIAGLLAGILLAGAGTARAEYSFCNKSSYALSAALGYVDDGRLVTRGWWRLRAGECKRVLTDKVRPGNYFVYAEAIPGHAGELKTWSGGTPLCVQNDSLFTLRNQDVCTDDPRRQREFLTVEIGPDEEGAYTTEFVDENNFTLFSAEVAGVQRLLRDVGHEVSHIDGNLGNATKAALRAYRRKKGLGDSGIINETVVDALIADANARDAQLGFFFCNATMLPVWAAFADDARGAPQSEPGPGAYRSSGWWRLESQECAKVRRGALAGDAYYVYGVMEAEGRSVPLAGGDTEFCVANVQFEAEANADCAGEGFEAASFRRIETDGEPAWTFQFTPEQFNPDLAGR